MSKLQKNANIAIDWWIKKIREADSTASVSEEQYKLFKNKLFDFILPTVDRLQVCVLWTINTPSGRYNIYDIADECDIPRELLPQTTSVIVTITYVSVSDGFRCPHQDIA